MEEGRALARKALDLANALKQYRAESHYNLARAYAICARNDPQLIGQTAGHLWSVFVSNPLYQSYYAQDSTFDPVRDQIAVALRASPTRSRSING